MHINAHSGGRRILGEALPMKIAIISDIHGNKEALEQILAEIDKIGIDDIISLGDHIGYGPEPERVIEHIRQRNIFAVQGNHELALIQPTYLDWFNRAARKSLNITRRLLSSQSVDYIKTLKTHIIAHGCRFVHGFPPDSVLTYLFQLPEEAKILALKKLKEQRCFIGHTHTLDITSYGRHGFESGRLKKGLNQLSARQKHIISAGSVGQPRDGNNQAKYIIWDSEEDTVEVRSVAYDIEAVVMKMKAIGLPPEHAKRLW